MSMLQLVALDGCQWTWHCLVAAIFGRHWLLSLDVCETGKGSLSQRGAALAFVLPLSVLMCIQMLKQMLQPKS